MVDNVEPTDNAEEDVYKEELKQHNNLAKKAHDEGFQIKSDNIKPPRLNAQGGLASDPSE